MIKIEEIFNKRIEEYIESNKKDIIKKINQTECNYLIENQEKCINSLIKQYTVNPITIDFNKIDYCEDKSKGYYQDGTEVENTIYTFNVSFEGNVELLSYRSNKGKYKDNTYFVENNHIYFKSLNFDLKPISKRFSNTVDILKSIIFNLNNEYETWNNNLPNFIKSHVKTRKEILNKFKEFCKKYKISEERIKKMKFQLNALEALSKIISETYTGSEITRLFKKAGFPEIVHDGNTKWKFVCETFENMQEESIEGFYKILKVLEVLCDPQEYLLTPEKYEDNLKKVNRVLSFYGLKFTTTGEIQQLENNEKTNIIISNSETIHENNYDKVHNPIIKKPLVFICHSSMDKERFVKKFIDNLEKYDIEPWYDDSKINGGNIIKKIDDAIKKSDYGIIIFSNNLKNSKFALREQDSLISKSIYENYTIIPVKIDNEAEIPQLINPFDIIEIKNINDYENELNKIIQIILENKNINNISKKNLIQLPNCSEIETKVFLELCKICMNNGFDIELDPEDILQSCQKYFENDDIEIIEDNLALSLKNLENQDFLINEGGNVGRAFTSKRISKKGFCFYFNNFIEEKDSKYLKLIKAILKDKQYNIEELVNESNLECELIEALIRIFRKQEYIICKSDLTILGITIKGKNYFKRIIGE